VSTPRLRACLLAVAAAALAGCADAEDQRTDILGYPDGAYPTEAVQFGEALLLYVALPAAILFVVAGLAWLPNVVRNSRYRPGRRWDAPPLWFGGPPDPVAAVEHAEPGELVRGGASGDW
jgi:hypothetical protein